MEGSVHLKKKNRIGRIKFFHPKGNSLPSALLRRLVKAFESAEADPEIGVIVLESRGNAFCAGASLSELKSVKTLDEATAFFMGFANLLNTIRKMSKFVLASVHGKVVGGGVGVGLSTGGVFLVISPSCYCSIIVLLIYVSSHYSCALLLPLLLDSAPRNARSD